MRNVLCCLLMLGLAPTTVVAQCSSCTGGRCVAPAACEPAAGRQSRGKTYDWRQWDDDPKLLYLFRGDVQCGCWSHAKQHYRSYDAASGEWGPRVAETPVPLPAGWRKVDAAPTPTSVGVVPNYGIDHDWLRDHDRDEACSIGGVPVAKEDAAALLAGDSLPADGGLVRVTVIGSDAEAGQVLSDLDRSPSLAPWKGKLVVQHYPPDHWAVSRSGFQAGGHPTVYLQNPDGKVLHRQDDYSDGSDGLAKALRRAEPAYDPKRDPDLRKTSPLSGGIPAPLAAIAGGLLTYFVRKEQ